MARVLYNFIYGELKKEIEEGKYKTNELLPSENQLVSIFECSRNTVRRAISKLAAQGYVQSVHGKGVFVIYQPIQQAAFSIGGIESFAETSKRNGLHFTTKVICFTKLVADERISKKTGFPVGEPLFYIQRVRSLNGETLILDINMFSSECVPGLTEEIAEHSIYDYIEKTLGMTIITSKRRMTVEKATELDAAYLDINLEDYNCLAVVTSNTYNSDGKMFEYTQSRHRPDHFSFTSIATRQS